jgi:hypothetical protein
MSRAQRKPAVPRVKVGAVVGLPDDIGIVVEMVVVEDCGDLGPNGAQVVGLIYRVEACDEEFYTRARVSQLVDRPTESWGDQWWRKVVIPYRAMVRRERRQARKAATA